MTENGRWLLGQMLRKQEAMKLEVRANVGREWTRQVSFLGGERRNEIGAEVVGIAPDWHSSSIAFGRCEGHQPRLSTADSIVKE